MSQGPSPTTSSFVLFVSRVAEFRSVPSCLTLPRSSDDCSPHPVVCTTLVARLAGFRSVPSCLRLTRSTPDCLYHPCRRVPSPTTSSFVLFLSRVAEFRSVPSCLTLTHSSDDCTRRPVVQPTLFIQLFARLLSSSSCQHNSLHAFCRIRVCALLPHAFSQSSRLLSS